MWLNVAPPIFKKKRITFIVAICPKCKHEMKEEKNIDARTLFTYRCPKCNYTT